MSNGPSRAELIARTFGSGKLKNAKVGKEGNWLRGGHYLARIDFVKLDQNRKGQTGFFVELTILHCYNPKDADPTLPHDKRHALGEEATHSMWSHHDAFLGNVKAFLHKILETPLEEVDESHIDLVTAEDQPLSSTVVELKARATFTKQDKPFTKVNYQREVPAAELIATLSPEVKAAHFKDGLLERMAQLESVA